ncbi:MAG: hypothetical protein AKCLJLPJ_00997 [Fimbriimonadales bacterium]|nr:hypothetical protein [Fimbriimonadales bacterium]
MLQHHSARTCIIAPREALARGASHRGDPGRAGTCLLDGMVFAEWQGVRHLPNSALPSRDDCDFKSQGHGGGQRESRAGLQSVLQPQFLRGQASASGAQGRRGRSDRSLLAWRRRACGSDFVIRAGAVFCSRSAIAPKRAPASRPLPRASFPVELGICGRRPPRPLFSWSFFEINLDDPLPVAFGGNGASPTAHHIGTSVAKRAGEPARHRGGPDAREQRSPFTAGPRRLSHN